MKIILISTVFSVYAITLIESGPIPDQNPPPHLTDEDFERAKTLTPEQYGTMLTELREYIPASHQDRTSVWRDGSYRWPNAQIPYVISPSYNSYERSVVAAAIQEWESKTCIRFVPATSDDRDYLELSPNDGTGSYCYSHIGRQGGRQFVKMYSPTCMSVGQYIHELGHAIGFGHEHQRPDRDSYVNINWQNIDPQFYYAFDKYSDATFTTMNMPYDYYSIMHYPDYSYSSNGQPSLTARYSGYSISNMNVVLTANDVQKTQAYYNC